ncbi:MAG: WGR domain-containing protein [Caulobacteraceae bacterium]
MIVLRKIDPSKNIARFYALSVEQTLFGEVAAVRRWGRIGSHGRRQEIWFGDHERADKQLTSWARAKVSRGYIQLGEPIGR